MPRWFYMSQNNLILIIDTIYALMAFGGMIVARRWSGSLELYGPGERAERDEYPAGISASHWRAAIRAQRARRGIRKEDLERCGVSVAEHDPSLVLQQLFYNSSRYKL
jgi:hypothetical protein